MSSKVNISCSNPDCNVKGVVDIDMDLNNLSIGGVIRSEHACPACGGELSAPSGTYEKNEEGFLVRVGDYTPPQN